MKTLGANIGGTNMSGTNTSGASIGIIGTSPQMLAAIQRVREVAPTDLTVLILGESGTGKEVFAQALHSLSKRRSRRMVSLNCGAIPEQLLESELFGSEKGAFTGATEQRKGFFEAADHSTIFLDELGEMPLGTQVKLLRVLESGEFTRLGSSEVLLTDVRVIAATNRNLAKEVGEGRFRRDLYYRLNTVQIELPALREHPDDIPELIQFFAHRTAAKIGADFRGIVPEALEILQRLPWTGNIRELRNVVETLVTLAKGRVISVEMLRPYLPKALKQASDDVVVAQFSNEAYSGVPTRTLRSRSEDRESDIGHEFIRERQLVLPAGNTGVVRVPHKTPEQVERELMYKALLDLVREVASLRGEIADIKDDIKELAEQKEQEMERNTLERNTLERNAVQGALQQAPALPSISTDDFMTLPMQEVEKRLITAALERYDGNRRQAADALGISERTLYRKLHEYGLLKHEE